jgi:AmpE protein
MKFLILFIAVLLHYQLPHKPGLRRLQGFQGWLNRLQGIDRFKRLGGDLRFVLVVILPALAFATVFWFVEGFAWGLPAAVLEIALLYLILSEVGSADELEEYREALLKGDIQGAFLGVGRSLSIPGLVFSNNASTMNAEVMRAVLYRWFEYFFLMVFWYMLADVAGVVLAWLTLHYARATVTDDSGKTSGAAAGAEVDKDVDGNKPEDDEAAVESVSNSRAGWYLHWLEWVPVRLLGLTYCLAGNMMSALPVWRGSLWNTGSSAEQILTELGSAALSFSPGKRQWHSVEDDGNAAAMELEEWHLLHLRSLSIWLVVIAVATIGGWML